MQPSLGRLPACRSRQRGRLQPQRVEQTRPRPGTPPRVPRKEPARSLPLSHSYATLLGLSTLDPFATQNGADRLTLATHCNPAPVRTPSPPAREEAPELVGHRDLPSLSPALPPESPPVPPRVQGASRRSACGGVPRERGRKQCST